MQAQESNEQASRIQFVGGICFAKRQGGRKNDQYFQTFGTFFKHHHSEIGKLIKDYEIVGTGIN